MAGPTIDWMKCVRIIASAIPIIDYIPSPRSIMAYTVAYALSVSMYLATHLLTHAYETRNSQRDVW